MQELKPLIVALDVSDADLAIKYVDRLRPHVDIFKVGPSLFLKYGTKIIKRIHWRRKKVFLDLKFHDIPNTVEAAVKAAVKMGVYAVSVHLAGGRPVLDRILALEQRPKIWGISMLTSIDDQTYDELGYKDQISDQVVRLASIGASCGIDGIVCSPAEVSMLKKHPDIGGKGIQLITPGIRLGTAIAGDDQKRFNTPGDARRQGADYIVVGRPILDALVPGRTAAAINNEIQRTV